MIEVDKVAGEVSDMVVDIEVNKVADIVVKILSEDFTDLNLAIGGTNEDNVRCGYRGLEYQCVFYNIFPSHTI